VFAADRKLTTTTDHGGRPLSHWARS